MSDSTEAPRALTPASRRRVTAIVVLAVIVALAIAAIAAKINVDRRNRSNQQFSLATKEGQPVQAIGPLKGADLKSYIDGREAALPKAGADRLAVVSLDHYATEADARALVGNSGVVGLLAAPPGGEPMFTSSDLKAWAAQYKASAIDQRNNFQSLLPSVDDPTYKAEYQSQIQRLTSVINNLTPNGPVVFAVVVRAPVSRLRTIAKAPGVRLVDAGSSATAAPGVSYTGIRPEETTKAGTPDTRPL